jgi:hypothetical protein
VSAGVFLRRSRVGTWPAAAAAATASVTVCRDDANASGQHNHDPNFDMHAPFSIAWRPPPRQSIHICRSTTGSRRFSGRRSSTPGRWPCGAWMCEH